MTKRYARIASAQVKDAVADLDSMLPALPEAEAGLVSHPIVTGSPALPEAKPVTQRKDWRPRRDLNPCYRRESTRSYRNLLKRCDTDGSLGRV
jgi:hypothetical protein